MRQPPTERKQPRRNLLDLSPVHKRSKGTRKHRHDTRPQLDRIEKPNLEIWAETVRAQQEDEIGGGEVEVDVFEAEEDGKEYPAEKIC